MGRKPSRQESGVRSRRAIVQLLKQEGALDAETLATRLGVTAMAVRQHLYALQDEQLVTYQEQARPMGRPAKLWQLTSAADHLFPDGYAELTLNLITSVKAAFGESGMTRLLDVQTQQQIDRYNQWLQGKRSLKQRLQTLVEIRTNEGYMADLQSQADGSFLFVEHHCPICAAATACTGFCVKELEVFQSVLGHVDIQQVEHILAGGRRCAYRVCERA